MPIGHKMVLEAHQRTRYVSNMTHRKRRNRRALAEAVKRVIDAAPSAPHRIQHMAAELGVSPFHLSRVFRAEAGISVHQYLLRIRMQQALSKLHAGEAQLSRLALDLGFSSHSHFSTMFRRHFGESPAQVRAALSTRVTSPIRGPSIRQRVTRTAHTLSIMRKV
jgi:AraC-like DNA-binding protein